MFYVLCTISHCQNPLSKRHDVQVNSMEHKLEKLISASECAVDSVTKFTSLVRARD